MELSPTMVHIERKVDVVSLPVALLRPPVVVALGSMSTCGPTPPVGLAYIAAALEEVGHDVQVVDSPAEAMESFEHIESRIGTIRRIGLTPSEMVARIRPETRLIGVTHMFAHEWPTVREIVELARSSFPDATIVVGGENATGFWKWMFEQTDAIDAVVLGEGEHTVVELAAHVAAGRPLGGMQGVVTPTPDGGNSGGLPVRFKKLDGIPRPAWHLFPMEGYFRYRSHLGVDRGRSMPLLATRGCPYRCTFCSSPQMWTTRYVVRDAEDVADEIADYVERFGIRNVDFVDLTPVTKRSWTIDLCRAIEARNLDVTMQLPIGTRSEAIDEEVLAHLKRAGVTNITFAPETGSPRMLEVYDKRADLDHIMESIRLASRAGMVTNIHIIVGHPKETRRDRWLSWKYMLRGAVAGLRFAGGTMFHPYPGSKDFIEMVESGQITVSDDYCYDGLARGAAPSQPYNGTISPVALHRLRLVMIGSTLALTYLLHPSRIVQLLRNLLIGGDEETVVEETFNSLRRGPLSRRSRGLDEGGGAGPSSPKSSDAERSKSLTH